MSLNKPCVKKILVFSMSLSTGSVNSLIKGKLVAIDAQNGEIDDEFIATSGCPGHQTRKSQDLRGKGVIPACSYLQGTIPHYLVSTAPISLKQTKGVEGDFYKITPHEVHTKGGVTRGDFGIHFDANVPGSAGCIVIVNPVAWQAYRVLMKHYLEAGITTVPLLVNYMGGYN